MRVVSGEFRGRRLVAPAGSVTRPTTDQAREALFNSLASMDVLRDAVVVDLFAGSGALGIEALSRGAARCTFVERDGAALRAIRDNLAALGLADRAVVVAADAAGWVRSHPQATADVVFADPPYDFDGWEGLLGGLVARIVVAETGRPFDAPAGWDVIRSRRYGRTHIAILEPIGRDSERGGAGTAAPDDGRDTVGTLQ